MSIVQTHTDCTTQVDKTRQNRKLQQRWRLNHRVTDTFLTERFATALKAEPQSYTHIIDTIDDVFLSADTKSIVRTHTFCTTQVDKNIPNRTFYNGVEDWITGLQTLTLQNILQRRWRQNHRVTDTGTFLTLLFANP